MPDDDPPHDAEIDEVSARLNDALKSCRSVVANYKALLAPDQNRAKPAGSGMPDSAEDGTAADEH